MSNPKPLWKLLVTYLLQQILAFGLVYPLIDFYYDSGKLSFREAIIFIAFVWAIVLAPVFFLVRSIWKDRKSIFKNFYKFPILRWFAYQSLSLALGLVWKFSDLGIYPYEFGSSGLEGIRALFWILIFTLPAVWVWRRPLLRSIRKLISYLNKAAEED